jgi:hypothetical protein
MRWLPAVLGALAAAVAARPAGAVTITLGRPDLTGVTPIAALDCTGTLCAWSAALNTALSTPGAHFTAPADGTITEWRAVGEQSGAGRVLLHVIRPNGDGSFTWVRTSAAATSLDGTTANNPGGGFAISVGDTIGLLTRTDPFNGVGFARVSATSASGGVWASISILSNQTASPNFTQPQNELLFNATVVLEAPVAGLVSPTSGPAAGGTAVTINGVHLVVPTAVTFGGVPATSFSAAGSQVTAVAPPHAAGLVEVAISTAGGTATAAVPFEYLAPPDVTPPDASGLAIARAAFRAANFGDSVAEAPARPGRIGGTVTYVLSEAATTTFTVDRVLGKGPDCVPPRTRRCTRYLPQAGSFTHPGAAGTNRFSFTGRLNGRRLRASHYRLVGVARDGAGNASETVAVRFRIVGGR